MCQHCGVLATAGCYGNLFSTSKEIARGDCVMDLSLESGKETFLTQCIASFRTLE